MDENRLSNVVIGYALRVHSALGPGLLESVYEECLAYELVRHNLMFERQKPIPVIYDSINMDLGFRADLLICKTLLVELKAVEQLAPIHTAQVLTYLKLTNCKLGLLLNFNSVHLRNGIKRIVLNL